MSIHISRQCFLSIRACLLVIFLTFSFIPNFVFAGKDGQEENVETLDPMVVTATKTPVPVSQLTSAVEVITEEDFERRHDRTVVDALRLSQGAAIFSNGGPGTTSTFRLRGGAADQTLVLIDGAIVNSATLGQFNFGTLTTDNIESITVLRGAQSMLWGSDAIGGVVDIRTKRGEGTPTARFFAEYGSFVTFREGGSVSGKTGPVDFSASVSRWDSAQFSAINYQRGARERDAFRSWQASSLLGVEGPRDGRFELAFRWVNNDSDNDNPSTFGGGPFDVFKAKLTTRNYVFSGTYHQPMTEWWDQKITLAHARDRSLTQAGTNQKSIVTGIESTPSSFGNSNIRTKSNRIEWQSNFNYEKLAVLTVGYQFREQLGKNQGNFDERILSSHAGFAQIQVNVHDRFFATGGFRQDSYNSFGDSTTWRATGGYLHKETGTKLRSSYATGFRAPTINELYFPNFGNPDLNPEKSQSFDVGIDQQLWGNRVKLSVGYFWNRFRDLIIAVFDPVGCAPITVFGFCAQNVGSAKSQGWEVSSHILLAEELPYMKLLEISSQYTYTLTRDLQTNDRLPRWPVHQASIAVTYQPIAPLSIATTFRYVGSRFNTTGEQQYMPDFHVINFAATYDFLDNLQGYIRVDNVLDRNYEEVQFFGTAIRSIFGGVRVQFDLPLEKGES